MEYFIQSSKDFCWIYRSDLSLYFSVKYFANYYYLRLKELFLSLFLDPNQDYQFFLKIEKIYFMFYVKILFFTLASLILQFLNLVI